MQRLYIVRAVHGTTALLKSLDRGKTWQTIERELKRLEKLGFIEIRKTGGFETWTFDVRFDAIAKY